MKFVEWEIWDLRAHLLVGTRLSSESAKILGGSDWKAEMHASPFWAGRHHFPVSAVGPGSKTATRTWGWQAHSDFTHSKFGSRLGSHEARSWAQYIGMEVGNESCPIWGNGCHFPVL